MTTCSGAAEGSQSGPAELTGWAGCATQPLTASAATSKGRNRDCACKRACLQSGFTERNPRRASRAERLCSAGPSQHEQQHDEARRGKRSAADRQSRWRIDEANDEDGEQEPRVGAHASVLRLRSRNRKCCAKAWRRSDRAGTLTVPNVTAASPLTTPRRYRLTVDAYDRMIDAGVFPSDARIELLEGVLYEMPPMGRPNPAVLRVLLRVF